MAQHITDTLVELKQKVGSCIDEAKDRLNRFSNDIWSCPELAYEERKYHDRLVTFFSEEKGWTVDSHFKLKTAFCAIWGPVGGKGNNHVINVGFLSEYDALPGIGHACGHNLIAEVGAAAVIGLKTLGDRTPYFPVPVQVMLKLSSTRAAKALAMTALDVLLCPELLQRAREELKEANLKEEWTLRGALKAKHCGGAAQH